MSTNTYEAIIKLSGAGTQKITVQADDQFKAKAMIEMQYGQKSIVSGPHKKL
jgi:hypothetical protein